MEYTHKLIPEQIEGVSKDLMHDLVADNIEEADEVFLIAKDRLLNVNNWEGISNAFSIDFQLTDNKGNLVGRHAHHNDYIRIDTPGPTTEAGKGYDWVHIEAIEYDDYPDDDYETFAMRLRPSAKPGDENEETAHYFKDIATSTFVVERRGCHIWAHYHGRNEKANTENESMLDKIRNMILYAEAWLIGSEEQWQGLIKGLLHVEPND